MRRQVLFCVEGSQHLEYAKTLASTAQKDGIYSSLFYAHPINSLSKLPEFKHVINDVFAVPGFLQNIGLVVFFTNETSPFCMRSNLISWAAKKSGASTVCIQHGWLQPGFNFSTDTKLIGFVNPADNSQCVAPFSRMIGWEGENGIGYPGLKSEVRINYPDYSVRELSILVCTNFNWGLYTKESIVRFYRSLRDLKSKIPSIRLMHRPHPAEKSTEIFEELGLSLAEFGLLPAPVSPIPFSSVIIGVDMVLTTPSTVVLDALSSNVPVFMYRDKPFMQFIKGFERITFSSSNELIQKASELIDNRSYPSINAYVYNENKVIDIINEGIRDSKPYKFEEEDFFHFAQYTKP